MDDLTQMLLVTALGLTVGIAIGFVIGYEYKKIK